MTRLSVNINDEVAAALREMATRDGTTVTEIVRRAVSVHYFFRTQQEAGKRIQLEDEQGRLTRVEFLP